MLRPFAMVGALLLSGCMVTANQDRFLAKYADPKPRLDAVSVCHGYGCRLTEKIDLQRVWPRLVAPLMEPAPDAAAERELIAQTIGTIERAVGRRTGTDVDVGGTFAGFAQEGQMDCVDEAANTTTYLTLLEDAGLLHWHQVRAPMSRGFFLNGWPHTSAVIAETATGESFAVDSWFHANGSPAEVVPLDEWLAGWNPEDGPAEQIATAVAQPAAAVALPARGAVTRRVIYSFGEEDERDAFVFDIDPMQYGMIVANLTRDGIDLDTALEKALAMLTAVVRMNDEDLSEDVLQAQSVAAATVWFLFNEAADEEDRVEGDVLLVEQDGDLFVAGVVEPGEG